MKKYVLSLVLFYSLIASAQDRVNRPKIKFDSSGETISSVTGWSFNKESGEWVGYQNLISSDQYKNYPSLKGSRFHKSNCSGMTFESLVFKKIIYSDTSYYVLLVDAIEGSYKYPNIKQDWESYNILKGYVFTEVEFNRLKNYQNGTIYFSVGGSRYDYSQGEETVLNKIITTLQNKEYFFESGYQMKLAKTEDGKNIRFLLPQSVYSSVDFSKNYFEIEINKYNTFANTNFKAVDFPSKVEDKSLESSNTSIKIDTISYDFGSIAEGKIYSYEFKFTNSGTSPLIISNVSAPCKCITTKWSKDPIQPGKMSSVTVEYDSKGRLGVFTKAIFFESNGGNLKLEVKGAVEN